MSGKKGKKAAKKAALEAERLAAEEKARLRTVQARLGGYAAAASLTAEQRSERARKAGLARAAKAEAARIAAGLPARVKEPSPRISATELSDWLEEWDRLHPDVEATYEERRSGALILFREYTAKLWLRK